MEQVRELLPLQNERFIAKEKNRLLVRVRNKLTNYVRECDYETYNIVVQGSNNRIRELLEDGKDRRLTGEVFQAYKFIIEPGIFEASRVGNFQYYMTIWESVDELYEFAAKNKIPYVNIEAQNGHTSIQVEMLQALAYAPTARTRPPVELVAV